MGCLVIYRYFHAGPAGDLLSVVLTGVHNEKSLKPLGQIYLWDRDKTISVRVLNNGLGPLIIDRLTFKKSDATYASLEDLLDLDPKSYMRVSGDDSVKRVILPDSALTIFDATLQDGESECNLDHIRRQLALITLTVEAQDIYDHKVVIERDFKWFSRHS